MVRGILANPDHMTEIIALVSQIKEKDEEPKPAAKMTSVYATVLPNIAILHGSAGGPPILHVNLDGTPPHIHFGVRGSPDDNGGTELVTLIYTGAVCTLGWLKHFEAAFFANQAILVNTFTYVG